MPRPNIYGLKKPDEHFHNQRKPVNALGIRKEERHWSAVGLVKKVFLGYDPQEIQMQARKKVAEEIAAKQNAIKESKARFEKLKTANAVPIRANGNRVWWFQHLSHYTKILKPVEKINPKFLLAVVVDPPQKPKHENLPKGIIYYKGMPVGQKKISITEYDHIKKSLNANEQILLEKITNAINKAKNYGLETEGEFIPLVARVEDALNFIKTKQMHQTKSNIKKPKTRIMWSERA